MFYTELSNTKDATLVGISQKSIKEITYHKRHSFSWVKRFGNGTEESLTRLQQGFDELWPFTGELFEMNEVDEVLLKDGLAVDLSRLKAVWEKEIGDLLNESHVQIPESTYIQTGSRKGLHSEHLGYILAEMQSLPRMHPTAKW